MVTKPNDVLGWSNTHWGMSEIEVLRLFPGEAERLDAGIEFRNPKRFATVRIPDRAIDGKRLTILFFFDVNDGLSEVILKPLPAKPIGYFEPLFGLLKQKYGSATLTDQRGCYGYRDLVIPKL